MCSVSHTVLPQLVDVDSHSGGFTLEAIDDVAAGTHDITSHIVPTSLKADPDLNAELFEIAS